VLITGGRTGVNKLIYKIRNGGNDLNKSSNQNCGEHELDSSEQRLAKTIHKNMATVYTININEKKKRYIKVRIKLREKENEVTGSVPENIIKEKTDEEIFKMQLEWHNKVFQ